MSDWAERIDRLDLGLFDAIESQTTEADRRSLLAVQRAVARKHGRYTYLEIGSHLGGSLQPHLVDERCERIYSIDARPAQQPDDRSPGYIAHYENNSTERMLDLLGGLGHGDLEKIECFDSDASEVEPSRITPRPQLLFIDGEHTKSAALSDWRACRELVSEDGTVLFHDIGFIYPALLQVKRELAAAGSPCTTVKLDDNIFAVFFDPDLPASDPYLREQRQKNRAFWPRFLAATWLLRLVPRPLRTLIRRWRGRRPD